MTPALGVTLVNQQALLRGHIQPLSHDRPPLLRTRPALYKLRCPFAADDRAYFCAHAGHRQTPRCAAVPVPDHQAHSPSAWDSGRKHP